MHYSYRPCLPVYQTVRSNIQQHCKSVCYCLENVRFQTICNVQIITVNVNLQNMFNKLHGVTSNKTTQCVYSPPFQFHIQHKMPDQEVPPVSHLISVIACSEHSVIRVSISQPRINTPAILDVQNNYWRAIPCSLYVTSLIQSSGKTLCCVFLELNNVAYRTTIKGDNT